MLDRSDTEKCKWLERQALPRASSPLRWTALGYFDRSLAEG
jgi:hypothetical protein